MGYPYALSVPEGAELEPLFLKPYDVVATEEVLLWSSRTRESCSVTLLLNGPLPCLFLMSTCLRRPLENPWSKARDLGPSPPQTNLFSPRGYLHPPTPPASIRLMVLIIPIWASERWSLASVVEPLVCLVFAHLESGPRDWADICARRVRICSRSRVIIGRGNASAPQTPPF